MGVCPLYSRRLGRQHDQNRVSRGWGKAEGARIRGKAGEEEGQR